MTQEREFYFALIPIEEITKDMLKESYFDTHGIELCDSNINDFANNLRIVVDGSGELEQSYGIIYFTSKYANNAIGYKKYTKAELVVELANEIYQHNELEL